MEQTFNTKLPIPIIETRGAPFQIGAAIGAAAGDSLRAMHTAALEAFGSRWDDLLIQAQPFLAATRARLPRVVEELAGCAQSAQIPFEHLFLMGIEELLYDELAGVTRGAPPVSSEKVNGCTDLAAAPPATADGHVWLAHNNDLGAESRDHLYVSIFRANGELEVIAVTVGGIFISIGLNRAGLSLTGNQLTANDARVGVPRLYIVREILAQSRLEAALDVALMPERASSYNNIIASTDGRIVNVEGSATSFALTWSDQNGGMIVHTNHYMDPTMMRFEADPQGIHGSECRCSRALDYANKYRGRFGFEIAVEFLRDHVYAPWSVCRHTGESVTVFGAIIDLTETKLWLARGNPCQSEFVSYPI